MNGGVRGPRDPGGADAEAKAVAMHLGGFVLLAIGFALTAALIGLPALWIVPTCLAILAFGALSTLARSRTRREPPDSAGEPPIGGPDGLP